jgi:flagellar basal body-associated protein FliL
MKKAFRYFIFSLLFMVLCVPAFSQQRVELLLKDRQKLYGTMLMRLDERAFRDTSIPGILNQIAEYDQSIAAEIKIVDSLVETNRQKLELLQSVNANFETEKQKVKTTLWIFIGLSIVLLGLGIYFFFSWMEAKNRLIFLKTDIDETNRNFSRLTNEKSEREEALKNEVLEIRKRIEYYETQLKNSKNESVSLRDKAIEIEKNRSVLLTKIEDLDREIQASKMVVEKLSTENQALSQQVITLRKDKETLLNTPLVQQIQQPVVQTVIQEPVAVVPPPVQTPQAVPPPAPQPVESKETVVEAAQRILQSVTANGKNSIADESFFSSIQQSGKNAMMDDAELSEAQKSLMELEVNLHKIAKIKTFKDKGILSEEEYEELKKKIFSHL